GSWFTAFLAAFVALALNEAAYMAEIFRAGLLSVDPGQELAGRALGMKQRQILRRVVVPQAVRIVIPPTGNEFITLLKLTSLASIISLHELLTAATELTSAKFQYNEPLLAALVYYLVIVSILMLLQSRLFRRFNLFQNMTALGNGMCGLREVRKLPKDEARRRALEFLARVGVTDKAEQYPDELSGGQQQRVAIARALVMRPKAMLFDEPTSALDVELVREVLDVMESLAQEGMTMVVVSHELRFAHHVASSVLMMDEGRIVEEAPPDEFFSAPKQERTRRFLGLVEESGRAGRQDGVVALMARGGVDRS